MHYIVSLGLCQRRYLNSTSLSDAPTRIYRQGLDIISARVSRGIVRKATVRTVLCAPFESYGLQREATISAGLHSLRGHPAGTVVVLPYAETDHARRSHNLKYSLVHAVAVLCPYSESVQALSAACICGCSRYVFLYVFLEVHPRCTHPRDAASGREGAQFDTAAAAGATRPVYSWRASSIRTLQSSFRVYTYIPASTTPPALCVAQPRATSPSFSSDHVCACHQAHRELVASRKDIIRLKWTTIPTDVGAVRRGYKSAIRTGDEA
ncbi:hypothetical protein HYPSUDRAFT_209967 [Hypholoma sublateritium FD-334 SS-4]|uniref:Uncharacterized protein n=1 Tax=Hypholoma sublateritium (strain FD-334 SS-4) TaxID=945553 RepID=A0A0D2N861_HYPSF|nr:hypothetical protein HYPSUDRAFT_209967 [Hypholoma sublateritium FD-334 SS-4]